MPDFCRTCLKTRTKKTDKIYKDNVYKNKIG